MGSERVDALRTIRESLTSVTRISRMRRIVSELTTAYGAARPTRSGLNCVGQNKARYERGSGAWIAQDSIRRIREIRVPVWNLTLEYSSQCLGNAARRFPDRQNIHRHTHRPVQEDARHTTTGSEREGAQDERRA